MSTFHVFAGGQAGYTHPTVRRISFADLKDALRLGWRDFYAKPSHLLFLVLIYPLAGIFFAVWTAGANALPMLFPIASGFALIGPLAAIGLYEISRQRERGIEPHWRDALAVRHSPALPSIIVVGMWLFALFIGWLLVAKALYVSLYGDEVPASLRLFLNDVLTTDRGWNLLIYGNLIGACFALVVLATTVVAFPLLLDRDVGAAAAVHTSVRAFATNPGEVIAWGLIVAVTLAVASIPLFVGLAIALPVLGHATWHLYRKLVA